MISVVGLDIQDDLGRHEVGFVENTDKIPLNDGAGCRFKAEFKINKVRDSSLIICQLVSTKITNDNLQEILIYNVV